VRPSATASSVVTPRFTPYLLFLSAVVLAGAGASSSLARAPVTDLIQR
jgi:hypothetical protein